MDSELKNKIETFSPFLNESQLRKYLASEAVSLGRGGIKEISAISGVHRNTIAAGIKELRNGTTNSQLQTDNKGKSRVRTVGGGRKPITESQPGILEALGQSLEAKKWRTAYPNIS